MVDIKGLFSVLVVELVRLIWSILSLKVLFVLVFILNLVFFLGEKELKDVGVFFIISKFLWLFIGFFVLLEVMGLKF